MILASFPPVARARMGEAGLVAPTVQFVMRRTQVGLRGEGGHLSGAAHPSAFAVGALNPPAGVALAAGLTPGTIPPAPVLRVLAEDFGPHAGLAELTERLFTTDAAVARASGAVRDGGLGGRAQGPGGPGAALPLGASARRSDGGGDYPARRAGRRERIDFG